MSAPSLLAVAPGSASTYAFVPNLPQEVKFRDIRVDWNNTYFDGWSYVLTSPCESINQGYGPSERIGRTIRVVGIVLRASVESVSTVLDLTPVSRPYTIDFLWDNRANDGIRPIDEVYGANQNIVPVQGLPNPLYSTKYQWIKRVDREPKHNFTTVNVTIPCNKVIDYTLAGDYPLTELYVTASCETTTYLALDGRLRLLYVDA